MQECIRYRVFGRVQGVFFRASTRDVALRLALIGWVRNCADGSVELVACGERLRLEELERWLWQGPELAEVAEVTQEPVPCENFKGFQVR